MKNDKMKVDLENILGGGFIGDMANEILTLIGEDFLYAHKDQLSAFVTEKFKSELGKFLDYDILIGSGSK